VAPTRTERATHDYVSHGTISLFAALDAATGQAIGKCHRRHRHQEFIRFPDHVHAAPPREPGKAVHVVLDNYGTHKTPAVKRWFLGHPEYHLHLTPTSASWLNQVDRYFAAITEDRIRRGAFKSVAALERAIGDSVAEHNANSKPFAWTADADTILESIKRVCERTFDSEHWNGAVRGADSGFRLFSDQAQLATSHGAEYAPFSQAILPPEASNHPQGFGSDPPRLRISREAVDAGGGPPL
jgi:hypothetical protein